MADPFIARIAQTLRARQLLAPRSRVLAAVSGGADSVALLLTLARVKATWPLTLHVAHIDHQLRPESAQDAAFVQTLAAAHRLPSHVERCDVRAACAAHHWSLEEGARRLRYERLAALANRQRLEIIALAHTADDQAETVLLRLLRGTGLRGLAAMEFQRAAGQQRLIRPMLDTPRQDVLAFLQRQQASFREDASNTDLRFTRNRIRHQLLPLLEQDYNPNIRQALLQLAQQSRSDYAYLAEAAQRYWKRAVKLPSPREAVVALRIFQRQPKALQRQLLRQVIEHLRGEPALVEYRHWLAAEQLMQDAAPGAVVDLPGSIQLIKRLDSLICRRAQ